jgi:ABC-type nitrate/sulfonate/bicarbonate transport system substrate-binding protein
MKAAVSLVMGVWLLAGCGGAAPPASAPASAPASVAPAKMVVGLGQAVAQVSPIWVAQDAGYFAKQNLEVDAKVAAATTGLAALLSGELNMQVGGGSELMNGIANGAELVALANLAPKSALRFEVAPSIKSKEDLFGKKLGITRFGSATHTASRALLTKIGLDPDKDVSFVQLDTPANTAAALIAGSIQGAMCTPPQCFRVEQAGMRPLYELADMDMPDTTAIAIVAKPWLNANRGVAQRFIDGLIQGIAREKQDKTLSVAALKRGLQIDNEADLSATYDYYVGHILASEPYAKAEHFVDVVSVINAQSGKLKDFDVNSVIDNSLVQSSIQRGMNKV